MANRYVAGRVGPAVRRRCAAYAGTDLPQHTATISTVTCPFTGEELAAVAGAEPGRQRSCTPNAPTARATSSCGGSSGVQKEVVLASRRALVTVEEIVDELTPVPGAVVLPHWVVDAVAVVPGGAAPSYAHGYYDRDNAAYRAWDAISRDRDDVRRWLRERREGRAATEREAP